MILSFNLQLLSLQPWQCRALSILVQEEHVDAIILAEVAVLCCGLIIGLQSFFCDCFLKAIASRLEAIAC